MRNFLGLLAILIIVIAINSSTKPKTDNATEEKPTPASEPVAPAQAREPGPGTYGFAAAFAYAIVCPIGKVRDATLIAYTYAAKAEGFDIQDPAVKQTITKLIDKFRAHMEQNPSKNCEATANAFHFR